MLLCPIGSSARPREIRSPTTPVEQGRAVLEERGDAIVAASAGVIGDRTISTALFEAADCSPQRVLNRIPLLLEHGLAGVSVADATAEAQHIPCRTSLRMPLQSGHVSPDSTPIMAPVSTVAFSARRASQAFRVASARANELTELSPIAMNRRGKPIECK